jgi:hypothetical protein
MTSLEASARALARPVAFCWVLGLTIQALIRQPRRQLLIELTALFTVKRPREIPTTTLEELIVRHGEVKMDCLDALQEGPLCFEAFLGIFGPDEDPAAVRPQVELAPLSHASTTPNGGSATPARKRRTRTAKP